MVPVPRGRFHGRTLLTREVGGLVLVHSLHSPGSRLPRHSHERAYFCLNTGGSYTEQYGRRTRTCRTGMLVFHPPGETHSEVHDGEPVSSLNVELGAGWMHRVADVGWVPDQPAEFEDDAVAAAGFRLFEEFSLGDPDSALAIESLAWEVVAASTQRRSVEATDSTPYWLRHARDLVDGHLSAPTLQGIAREAGVHPVHFAAVFRRHLGCSLGEYVRRRRLETARRELAQQELPLAEVALRAGFADQSHLNRAFKRFTGMTPRQYRTFLAFKSQ